MSALGAGEELRVVGGQARGVQMPPHAARDDARGARAQRGVGAQSVAPQNIG
jgi:hypothetical protein